MSSKPRIRGPIESEFMERLYAAMTALGITQSDLARRSGDLKSVISKSFAGSRAITLTDASRWSSAIGVPLSMLISSEPMVVTVTIKNGLPGDDHD